MPSWIAPLARELKTLFSWIDSYAVVVVNISNNANLRFTIHGALARIHERYAFNSRRKAIHTKKAPKLPLKESLRTQFFARFHLNCRNIRPLFYLILTNRKVVSPSVPIYLPHSQGQALWKIETALLVFTNSIVTISVNFVNLFSAKNCFFPVIFS